MSWEDRIVRSASYTPPSGGDPIVFAYENFDSTVDKRTSDYQFPEQDGMIVQDLGRSGRKCPITAIFHGSNCDLEAKRFEDALYERGAGLLEHPVYGRLTVVPFGAVQRRDHLVTRANVTTVQVTFWEVIESAVPAISQNAATQALVGIEETNAAAAEDYNENTEQDTVEETVSLADRIEAFTDVVTENIRDVAQTVDDVEREYDAIENSILRGIDTIVGQPLATAAQVQQLIQAPARAVTLIQNKFDGYRNLLSSLISEDVATPGLDNQNSNEFHLRNLYATATVTAVALSAIESRFTTAPEALTAAETLISLFEDLTNWRDDNFESLGQIDTGGGYQALQDTVAITAGYLVQISFSAAQERSIILDRARTIIDLCAELYGEVDDRLDFLINSNSLTGSEILELPAGKEILYYV